MASGCNAGRAVSTPSAPQGGIRPFDALDLAAGDGLFALAELDATDPGAEILTSAAPWASQR